MEDVVSASARLSDTYRGRRVLVTGNTGFKGSWLALWLTQLGAKVVGFSDAVPTSPSHFERLPPDYLTIYGDIADPDAVFDAIQKTRPDIIFHLAAQSLVHPSYSNPIETYRTNLIGSLVLLDSCWRNGGVAAVVSATTDKVYRNREWDWGYRELDELGGRDPYSASKSCVELMTDSWRHSFAVSSAPQVATVRAGNVIGGGDWAADRLLPDIVRAAFEGQRLQIRSPSSTRPWQHVLDPLCGYLRVGAELLQGRCAGAWNFGPVGRQRISVQQIVSRLQERLPHLDVVYEADAAGPRESGLLELDSSKAAIRLSWQPLWEDEMLDRTLEWYEAYYKHDEIVSGRQLESYGRMLDEVY